MNDDDYAHGQDFVDLATQAQLNFEDTISALGVVVSTSARLATADVAALLREADGDVRYLAREIIEKLAAVSKPTTRTDLFDAVEKLVEFAFAIGAQSAEAQALGDQKKKIQQDRGKASGLKSKGKKEAWHAAIIPFIKNA